MRIAKLQELALDATQQAVTSTGLEGAQGKIPRFMANRIATPEFCRELFKKGEDGFSVLGTATSLDLSKVRNLNESRLQAILSSLAKGRDLFCGQAHGVTAIQFLKLPWCFRPGDELLRAIAQLCPNLTCLELPAVTQMERIKSLKSSFPALPLHFSCFRPRSVWDLQVYGKLYGEGVRALDLNWFGWSGERLCPLLRKAYPNLERLDFNYSPNPDDMKSLLEGLPEVELHFSYNQPKNRGELEHYLSLFKDCPERLRCMDLTLIADLTQEELDRLCEKYPNIHRLRIRSKFITSITALKAHRIDCVDCAGLKSLSAPRLKSIDCTRCIELTSLNLSNASWISCEGCVALTSLSAPKVTQLYSPGCQKLSRIEVPQVEVVWCKGCTSLESLSAPKARTVLCSSCPKLTDLHVPEAREINCTRCTGLKSLRAPKARRIKICDCDLLTTFEKPSDCGVIWAL